MGRFGPEDVDRLCRSGIVERFYAGGAVRRLSSGARAATTSGFVGATANERSNDPGGTGGTNGQEREPIDDPSLRAGRDPATTGPRDHFEAFRALGAGRPVPVPVTTAGSRSSSHCPSLGGLHEGAGPAAAGAAIGAAAAAAYPPGWTLACTPTVVTVGSTAYYQCGSAWYTRAYRGGEVAYIMSNSPPGD